MRGLSCGERAILQQDGDEEPIGNHILSQRTLTARVAHGCDHCPKDDCIAYCRLHGGVAEIGQRAKAALQALSDREAQAAAELPPPPDEPADEQPKEGGVVLPFARPRRLPAPRYPIGHSISSSHPWPRSPTGR